MSRPKKLRTYIPEKKAGTSPSELLKTDKHIVLVGKAGVGKTAVTQEMLKLWAQRDDEGLDYMFYFDMRETSDLMKAKSLEELLFSFSEPDEDKEEVLNDMKKNSDSVTIIFDGVTDLSSSVVEGLVQRDLLPEAKIIVTCRPDDEDEELLPADSLRVEVKGFGEQSIKTYLSSTLGEEHKKVLDNLELFSLCHVPMYALMVSACCSSQDSPQPCTVTEIYINIVRFCLQKNSNRPIRTKYLDLHIRNMGNEILSLAEAAFHATEGRSVNLTDVPCTDSCVLSFLRQLVIRVCPTQTKNIYAFLHYTMQEFFAALWLFKQPGKIRDVLQQCLTREKKHMRHLIPFMCRLLSEKKPSLMECLIPAEELKRTSDWFFQEMMTTFHQSLCEPDESDAEDTGSDVDILFLCQCLYESQCPEACVSLLDKLDYCLDLSGRSLDPDSCCAVAYVVTQSKERKVQLELEEAIISEPGLRRLFGCLQSVQWCDLLLWKLILLSEGQMDRVISPVLAGDQMHLPVEGKKQLFDRAVKVLQEAETKVDVCFYWERPHPVCQRLCLFLSEALPYIRTVSFVPQSSDPSGETTVYGNLICAAAEREDQTGEKILETLASVWRYSSFPLRDRDDDLKRKHHCDFLLDLFSHVKDYETKTGLRVLPALQSVLQSAPSVWTIDLSERKTSILLEVLKLQPEKKPVELTGWSGGESGVRSLLQCLPYISQLSFVPQSSDPSGETTVYGNLICAAAEREDQTGEKILEMLTSSVLQSAPSVWTIDLSERKTSILLEVLKLQPEKKPVKLTGWSDEESEVRSFLQCLPYISQLSFAPWFEVSDGVKLFVNLFCAAAEREDQTGEKILETLTSVCRYTSFPLTERDWMMKDDVYIKYQCDFLLDLFSHVKDHETKTGLRVLPALQSVLQSAPSVWTIDLSERKTSILLEVLQLQPEKKPVELTGWSGGESGVRSFLQCLPYISELSVSHRIEASDEVKLFGNLFCAAAEREHETGEKMLETLTSAWTGNWFFLDETYMDDEEQELHCSFLLDLFSHVKDHETKTGLRVLPALQSVLQSAPSVWTIDLSERKTSILLEVLQLQPEKKPMVLTGWSGGESGVRSFLQCLPYISELSFSPWFEVSDGVKLFVNLFCAAAEREDQTGEKILETLTSACRYTLFPLSHRYMDDKYRKYQSDFLLDLFSHVKDSETKTGLRVVPALQSVLQSAPSVWIIDLSERKTSILLEVLKLQPEKKPMVLTGWSGGESEVWSFLQCLPHISQLSCDPQFFQRVCSSISVQSREEVKQLASLLQLLDFTLLLTGHQVSVRGLSLLFRSTTRLHSLRLSNHVALLLCRCVRRRSLVCPVSLEELSLVSEKVQPSERKLLQVVSGVGCLLRHWEVRRLDLTELCVPARCLVTLLLHRGPLTVKLSAESFQQLPAFLHEIQDQDLTRSTLTKTGGDLSSCCLDWDLLHYLLQHSSAQTFTVNLRKHHFLQENFTQLLPFLDRIIFKRFTPSFLLTAIREIYKTHSRQSLASLLRSLDHVINLTCTELDSVDCAALLFILRHSDRVKLNLLWTSIPAEKTESILFTLHRVSQLSVDRNLLLRFIHCCAACDVQQEAASELLRATQHRLDLSCSRSVDLSEQDEPETLCLTAEDCRAVSSILRHSSQDTQLDLRDCEVDHSGLDLLFPVLHKVRLRARKAVVLRLVSLVPVSSERDTVRRAVSLSGALGGELDLSHTALDQRVCEGLGLMLDSSEGLKELDLSHCQLTDQLLLTLTTHLHKVQVLDLSHNTITDASTDQLLQLVSINPSMESVRLFGNNMVNRAAFQRHRQFE
ncbi:hypothetical protein INR49_022009, partial [Caranx melampygus]